jgi:dTDP-4-dehydrorhamnose 3,5-epimerase-like enzyme
MLTNLKTIKDDDGTLVPIEFSDLPFEPKRIFYVCNVPKGEERGNHAHFETRQLLMCLQGSILVKIHDGKDLKEYRLMPNQSILVERMIWDSQVFETDRDVLLSICSTSYNKSDYIEDFEDFLRTVNKKGGK